MIDEFTYREKIFRVGGTADAIFWEPLIATLELSAQGLFSITDDLVETKREREIDTKAQVWHVILNVPLYGLCVGTDTESGCGAERAEATACGGEGSGLACYPLRSFVWPVCRHRH